MWYCHKDRATDRDKLIMHSPESPQGCQDHSVEKDDFFQQMVLEQLGSCRGKKIKLVLYLTPHIKMNQYFKSKIFKTLRRK